MKPAFTRLFDLNNAEKFKTTLANSVKTLNLEYREKIIAGHTYHHLKIPSFYQHYLEQAEIEDKSGKDKTLNKALFKYS